MWQPWSQAKERVFDPNAMDEVLVGLVDRLETASVRSFMAIHSISWHFYAFLWREAYRRGLPRLCGALLSGELRDLQ